MLLSYFPIAAFGAERSAPNAQAVTGVVADPGTAHTWEHMMGTDVDGNRYAGRVWVDKSVYKNGDVAKLNSKNEASSSFVVSLDEDEAFQVVFSALGSTMTTTSTTTSTGPMDVVLVLDTSTSMDDTDRYGVTRLQRTIEAANLLLSDLLNMADVRIAIVTYNQDSETVLPLAVYKNGIKLVVTDYFNNGSSDAGVVTAYDNDQKVLGKDNGYTMGTNLQSGIDRGFNILANASDVEGRIPVAIVLTDGQANRASQEGFYELSSHSDNNGTGASGRNLYLSTLLNAAYNKTKIEEHYKNDATIYTVGVDVTTNQVARLLMNPADATYGFYSTGSDREIRKAYENFQTWANGQNVSYNNWSFDHNYPKQNGAITDAKIAANILYADTYYDVSNADIADTFEQIYQELSSGVFNPISSSTTVEGGTGVKHTPLIYVDFIGKHMEVKNIQAVSLFGASYDVIKNADNTYSVATATGTNPTTNEKWNTNDNIRISITEQNDGTQKLEIRIDQEILPILMERVTSETVGDETSATIIETTYNPLRIFYTVGLDSDILLPNGQVNVQALSGYKYLDAANGKATFYSNAFGSMNPSDVNGDVLNGDAHVGFKPSQANRYYYHQSNQGIFTKITDKAGKKVEIPENEEHGIVWDESQYDLTWMSLNEYRAAKDSDTVYTYVTYFRPTPATSDPATSAEEITYLIYGEWGYYKESVSFYDDRAGKYVNYDGNNGFVVADEGVAIPVDKVDQVLSAYTQSNPAAQLYAVLGVGSLRTSRLHNMMVDKTSNPTGTAKHHYTPEYTHETASVHNGNDVVVWLGNNGRLEMDLDTGIALTKNVTRAIGTPDDLYELAVKIPAGVAANPVVTNSDGDVLGSGLVSYSNNVLTVKVRASETVYISGIPEGTVCTVDEVVPENAEYYVSAQSRDVKVPTISEVLAGADQYAAAYVTNAPKEYGNLFITKELTSDHAIPEAVQNTAFDIVVDLGSALKGKSFTVELDDNGTVTRATKTADENGKLYFSIKARHTIEIFAIPAGTNVTVAESDPGSHFTVSYRTRNHSGDTADQDNAVLIPENANATAVVLNQYSPESTSVELDIAGTKNFIAEGAHNGGTFTFKVQKYENGNWVDVNGKSASVTYADNEHGEKNFRIVDVLDGIAFNEVGSFAYRVLEVEGSVENVTYDKTIHSFNVHVTDNNGLLIAMVVDEKQAEITDGSYEILFTNTYHTVPVTLDIFKLIDNKSGDSNVSKEGFEIKAVRTDANWNPLTGADASSLSLYTDASGHARFANVCTKEGTYYFVLSEVDHSAKGWTYSKAIYRVTLVVDFTGTDLVASLSVVKTDSTNVNETASVNGTVGSVTFENTYDPKDVNVDMDGRVSKELSGKALESHEFTFYVYENNDRTTPVLVGKNDLNGDVKFVNFDKELVFSEAGKYEFDVVESIPDGAVLDPNSGKYHLNGLYYDSTIFDLVVEVVNDPVNGELKASYYFEDSVSDVVTFRNSYVAVATDYTFSGSKILHGRAPRDGEFFFELYEGSDLIETVSSHAGGDFSFKKLTFTEAGVYTCTVKEKSGSVAGVTYDGVDHPITIVVTVTDQNGVLNASASVPNSEIKFENTYTAAPAKVNFSGTKNLRGGDLSNYKFSFNLYQTASSYDVSGNATLLQTVENVGTSFTFGTRTLSKAGTYYFVIAEDLSSPVENIVYDRSLHRFAVSVSDNGAGQLVATIESVESGSASASSATVSGKADFVNATFEEVTEKDVVLGGATITSIDGKKVKSGDVLTYYITYTNYNGQDVIVDIMDAIPNFTSYVEGSASHGGTYAGTHLDWVLHVKKCESVTVSFSVKVDEPEVFLPNTAVIRDGVNTYRTNEVVNHTIDNVVVKDVFQSSDPEISIDGKKVYEGDELLYTISYINASAEVIDLEILDTIPLNTTYVEGSADNGGVYSDGKVLWLVEDVPAWSTVRVSFKVTVNAKVGATKIVNEAKAFDGHNHVTSNQVVNHTVSDTVKKDSFLVSDPSVSIDGKKVKVGDELVYTISYKNTDTDDAAIVIKDFLPVYVSYVDGSATHGGIFEDGTITWDLTVASGESVTVSFKAKVTSGGEKTVENKAFVQEGKNIYTTNTVKNPVEPSLPVIPATGDNSNLALWFALMFVSGIALFEIRLRLRVRKSKVTK